MAVTPVAGSAVGSSSSTSISKPVGYTDTAGDLILIAISSASSTITSAPTPPTGFTTITSKNGGTGVNGLWTTWAYKINSGSETWPKTWTQGGGSGFNVWQCIILTGNDASSPLDATGTPVGITSGTSLALGTLTATTSDDTLVIMVTDENDVDVSTWPISATKYAAASNATGNGVITGTKTGLSSGSTGSLTTTLGASPGTANALALLIKPAPVADVPLQVTTIAAPTGSARAGRLIYAQNSARWWFFYLSDASTLGTAYSSDGVTWTTGPTHALGQTADGWDFGVYYANIASTDVVHISVHASNTSDSGLHLRTTISGTSLGTFTTTTIGTGFYQFEDAAVLISSDGHVRQMVIQGGDWYGYAWPNADAGTSWTVGTPVSGPGNGTNSYKSAAIAQTSATHMLVVLDDSVASGVSETTAASYQLTYGTFNGTTWADQGSVGHTTAVNEKFNNWNLNHLSDTDIHLVHRIGTNTYEHARYNGSSWVAGDSIPTQTSVDGGGIAMWNDGTHVYMAVIDSASGNAVRYNTWTSGTGWGTWTDLIATSSTRSNLGVSQTDDGTGNWLLYWTDGSASPWAVKVAVFTVSGGGTTWIGQAALSGELDIVAAAVETYAGASALSGQANLTAAGVRTYVAQAVLSGQMNLTTAAGTLLAGAAALQAEGDLAGAGVLTLGASSILAGELDLVAQAAETLAGQAALAAELDLSATGQISGGPSSAQLSGQLNLTASASVQRFGQASLSGQMNLVAQAAMQLAGAAVLSGALNLSADALRTIGASASLSGEADMTVLAALHLAAQAAMQAEMDMSVLAALTLAGAAALSGELDLAVGAASGGYVQPLATVLLEAALSVSLAFDAAPSATIILESTNDGSVE